MKNYNKEFDDETIKKSLDDNTINRNRKLLSLLKVLNGMNDNHIISLDGAWGSGKTFFIKQLMYIKRYMDDIPQFQNTEEKRIVDEFDEKYLIVYYNAWENDDHDNPLESMIYNVLEILPKYNNVFIEGETFEFIKETFMNFVEKSSLGIVKKEDLEKCKSFANLADSVNTIEEKKREFNKLINYLTRHRRLLLIVDELDRCKPDYAVKTIETLKHFYNNPNISIIVATNNSQLSNTIKKFYGENFDGYGYLNKIYDAVVTLNIDNIDMYVKRCLGIANRTNLPENFTLYLFKKLNFSYRECNSYMSMYDLILPYIEYNDRYDVDESFIISRIFVPLTIALKIKRVNEYEKFISGRGEKMIEEIFSESMIEEDKNMYDWLSEIFKKKEGLEIYRTVITEYKKIFNNKEYKYRKYPFMEAISMLGPLVYLEG